MLFYGQKWGKKYISLPPIYTENTKRVGGEKEIKIYTHEHM